MSILFFTDFLLVQAVSLGVQNIQNYPEKISKNVSTADADRHPCLAANTGDKPEVKPGGSTHLSWCQPHKPFFSHN
jgi:hypothetical protein